MFWIRCSVLAQHAECVLVLASLFGYYVDKSGTNITVLGAESACLNLYFVY